MIFIVWWSVFGPYSFNVLEVIGSLTIMLLMGLWLMKCLNAFAYCFRGSRHFTKICFVCLAVDLILPALVTREIMIAVR